LEKPFIYAAPGDTLPKRMSNNSSKRRKAKSGWRRVLSNVLLEVRDWAIWIGIAIILAPILGWLLTMFLGNATPLVAVMSTSMVHDWTTPRVYTEWMVTNGINSEAMDSFPFKNGFDKGDVLVILAAKKPSDINVGNVIVFNADRKYPIIHRVIAIQATRSNSTTMSYFYMTKGDHNPIPDPWITPYNRVEGRAVFRIPYIGYIKVIPIEILDSLTGGTS